jgi:hypothetical protein
MNSTMFGRDAIAYHLSPHASRETHR